MAVIEIVRFRTKTGVDEAEMTAVYERFQREIAPVLPGLERRGPVRRGRPAHRRVQSQRPARREPQPLRPPRRRAGVPPRGQGYSLK